MTAGVEAGMLLFLGRFLSAQDKKIRRALAVAVAKRAADEHGGEGIYLGIVHLPREGDTELDKHGFQLGRLRFAVQELVGFYDVKIFGFQGWESVTLTFAFQIKEICARGVPDDSLPFRRDKFRNTPVKFGEFRAGIIFLARVVENVVQGVFIVFMVGIDHKMTAVKDVEGVICQDISEFANCGTVFFALCAFNIKKQIVHYSAVLSVAQATQKQESVHSGTLLYFILPLPTGFVKMIRSKSEKRRKCRFISSFPRDREYNRH